MNSATTYQIAYSDLGEATMEEGAAQQWAWILSLKKQDSKDPNPAKATDSKGS